MDEVWVKAALVAGAFAVAAGAVVAMRRRSSSGPRRVDNSGLGSGVYLFTSSACADCDPARDLLVAELGSDGFVELIWDDSPEPFIQLAIGEVPATVVVARDGSADIYPGRPDEALSRLDR